jgi:ABC-type Mn2+/Zn2+ transport system permease subunit
VVLGLAASRQWALASGGTIVLVAVAIFAVVSTVQALRSGRGAQPGGLLTGPH